MNCLSCQTDIDPKWRHAIEQNVCPFCGKDILDGDLKKLLSSLHSLLEALKDFPKELDDWMLSNFNYINISSDDIINYVSPELLKSASKPLAPGSKKIEKIFDGKKEQEVIIEKIQDENETSSFHARALNKKTADGALYSVVDRNAELREIANKIKKSGGTEVVYEDDLQNDSSDEESTSFDDEYASIMEMQTRSVNKSQVPEQDIFHPIAGNISPGDVPKTKADFEIMRKIQLRESQRDQVSDDRPKIGKA